MLHILLIIFLQMKHSILLFLVFSLIVSGCGNPVQQSNSEELSIPESNGVKSRGIYHWKTTFDLSAEDTAFIKRHDITRLYVRMFDVGMEINEANDSLEVVPLGTTRFKSKIPEDCALIPTVFITQDALKAYCYAEWKLAELIVTRIKAMCSWNELGAFNEIQYDCDWTESSRKSFEKLCESTKKILKSDGISLSGTIRLHQLEEATYPFDRGVLMIYNTGSFKNPNTENSILDFDDVYKYLSVEKRVQKFLQARKENCPIIDVAYPTYGWGVVFDENRKFNRLVTNPEEHRLEEGETIRLEMGTYSEIMKVKALVDSTIASSSRGCILYHLDDENLNRYKSHEIENIYN